MKRAIATVGVRRRRGYCPAPAVDDVRTHLEPKELLDFFNKLPETGFWHSYFFINYMYGCRVSEPALMLDTDVAAQEQRIVIKRLKKTRGECGYREHSYFASAAVLDAVKTAQKYKQQKRWTANPFLFPSSIQRGDEAGAERLSRMRHQMTDGVMWQAVSRWTAMRVFERVAQNLGFPVELQHSMALRDTRAVLLLASGTPIEQVQHNLGQSDIKMTQRYTAAAKTVRGLETLKPEFGL
jgi:site-specific recombinase XerD